MIKPKLFTAFLKKLESPFLQIISLNKYLSTNEKY